MIIDYASLVPSSVTATSAAAGYAASQLALPQIGLPWRSTSTATQQVVIDLGATQTIASVWVQHLNAQQLTVERATVANSYTTVGTLTTRKQGDGRRKGRIALNASARYLRLTIAAGTPTDGAAYWELGAVYLFAGSQSFDSSPNAGLAVRYEHPQQEVTLANGQVRTASTGPSYAVLAPEVEHWPDEDLNWLVRQARTGTIGLDLELTSRPWALWPVRNYQKTISTSLRDVVTDTLSAELVEVV